jgi:hypothetical protein
MSSHPVRHWQEHKSALLRFETPIHVKAIYDHTIDQEHRGKFVFLDYSVNRQGRFQGHPSNATFFHSNHRFLSV